MNHEKEKAERIARNQKDIELEQSAHDFMLATINAKYSYNFNWMGRPIIQYPQDMIALQEIIWELQPDCIIETGIAHGGSIIYYASLLELMSSCGLGEGKVIGIDIDIRKHNRQEIEAHPMYKRITMIEGSSIDQNVIEQVQVLTKDRKKILVVLDSNHTHDHVLAELEAYAPMVATGSFCVVFDTIIEDLPDNSFPDRSWGKGNNPKTAVWEYLKNHPEFEIDQVVQNKLLLTVAPDGYLRRVK